jgi:hypothetical protein
MADIIIIDWDILHCQKKAALSVPFGVAINLAVANVPHFGKLSGGTISSIFELMLLKSLFVDCHPNPAPSIK